MLRATSCKVRWIAWRGPAAPTAVAQMIRPGCRRIPPAPRPMSKKRCRFLLLLLPLGARYVAAEIGAAVPDLPAQTGLVSAHRKTGNRRLAGRCAPGLIGILGIFLLRCCE